MNMKILCAMVCVVFAFSLAADGGASPASVKPDKRDAAADPATAAMAERVKGTRIPAFSVQPPMCLKEAFAVLQKSAPGIQVRVKTLKDGQTPVVPRIQVEDASFHEIAMILCCSVDYSFRITPKGIVAEPTE